jgi:hypothetical protein
VKTRNWEAAFTKFAMFFNAVVANCTTILLQILPITQSVHSMILFLLTAKYPDTCSPERSPWSAAAGLG